MVQRDLTFLGVRLQSLCGCGGWGEFFELGQEVKRSLILQGKRGMASWKLIGPQIVWPGSSDAIGRMVVSDPIVVVVGVVAAGLLLEALEE